MINLKTASLALAISSLTLAGCGGSGSSSSSSPSTPVTQPPSATQVSGAAVKGVLRQAQVVAWELDANGAQVRKVGEAITDADGQYSIDLTSAYQGGVIEIEVSATPETRMVCDATDCAGVARGEEYELPDSFRMSAVTANPDGAKTLSAPVTAWSTMAANRAKALVADGRSLSQAATRAAAEVSLVAGFDVARTPARSITNMDNASEAEKKAAVMNAVIAEVVFQPGGTVESIAQRFESLAKVLEDGKLDDDDSDFTSAVSAASAAIIAIPEVKEQLPQSVISEVNLQAELIAEGIDAGESINDDLLADGVASKVEQFQQFVAQVRAWASSIEALDGDQLATAINADQDTIRAIFDETTQGQFEYLGLVVDSVNRFLMNNLEEANDMIRSGGTKTVNVYRDLNEQGELLGTATLAVSNNNGLRVQVTGTAGGTHQPVALTLQTTIPVTALELTPAKYGTLPILSALQQNNVWALSGSVGNNLKLNDLTLTLNLSSALNSTLAGGVFGEEASTLDARFVSASLTGDIEVSSDEGDRFTGNVDVELSRLADSAIRYPTLNASRISLKRFKLSGGFMSSNPGVSSFDAAVTLNVDNSTEFDVVAWADFSGNRRWTNESVTEAELALIKPDYEFEPVIGYVTATAGNGWGHIYGEQFQALGEPVSLNYFNPSAEAIQIVAESVADILGALSAIPGTWAFSEWGGDPTLFDAPPFDIETLRYASFHGGQYDGGGFTFSAPALLSGQNGQLVHVGEEGDEVHVGWVSTWEYDGGSGTDITIEQAAVQTLIGNDTFNNATSRANELLAGIPGAENVEPRFYYNRWDGRVYGDIGISYTRTPPADDKFAHFDACLENPGEVLRQLTGSSYGRVSQNDAYIECARVSLTSVYSDDYGYGAIWSELSWEQRNDLLALAQSKLDTSLGEAIEGDLTAESVQATLLFGEDAKNLQCPASLSVLAQFPDLETADYFLKGNLTVSATVDLPDLDVAKATVALQRSQYRGGEISANLVWNGGNYTVRAVSENVEELTGIGVEFFNAEGYRLTVNPVFEEVSGRQQLVDLTGQAWVGNDAVGVVKVRNTASGKLPVIEYPTGATTVIETLF